MSATGKPFSESEILLDQAVAEFLRAAAEGEEGLPETWLARFPSCAAGLSEFFDDRQKFDRLLSPLRPLCLSNATVPASSPTNQTASVDALSSETGDFEASGETGDGDTFDYSPDTPTLQSTRYRTIGFHARGGMGEVWLAEDERIGRRIALKKIRSGSKSPKERFLLEAQVTGQLQHPGIVPVHDMGIDEAGQPYYIMKFIEGRSFGTAISEYRAKRSSRDWPRERAFLRLLETFIDVCNTVAYAHNNGVLHRDVKPENVMIGSYGETLLLDWGLAKIIGQSEASQESASSLKSGASNVTMQGAVVGSPFYMPPEAAEGHAESFDRRSDVFLLGATLFEILTGRAPRQGSSQWELISQARKSPPAPARQIDSQVPRSLEAICSRAMAFNKIDRYDSPLALAEDVQRYIAGDAVSAYREPFVAQTVRWLRRHRRPFARTAVLGFGILLCGLAATSYQRARYLSAREDARVRTTRFYHIADEAQYFAANIDLTTERAPYYDPQRALALGELAVEQVALWLDDASRLPIPEERSRLVESHYHLLLWMAQIQSCVSSERSNAQKVLAIIDRADIVRPGATPAYFELRSACMSQLGDPQAARQATLEATRLASNMDAQDHFLKGEQLRLRDVGQAQGSVNSTERRRQNLSGALEHYQQAVRIDPQHYWAQYQLGRCLLALDQCDQAAQALSVCIALRPGVPWAYATRGLSRALAGQTADGVADLNRAIELDPDFRPAHVNRGVAYWMADDYKAALADFDAALAPPLEKRLGEAAFYRGQLLLTLNRVPEALADLNTAIIERPRLQQAFWQRAHAHFRIGNDQAGKQDVEQSLAIANSPDIQGSRLALGIALRRLGSELDSTVQSNALRMAEIELVGHIAASSASAEAYENLGAVYELLGQSQKAIASYTEGLAIEPNSVSLLNLRGWSYIGDGDFILGRIDFEHSVLQDSEQPEGHAGLGYVLAKRHLVNDARKHASNAILYGAENYLVLHNVACIYAELSQSEKQPCIEYENMALAMLQRELALWHAVPNGPDPHTLIQQEVAFPESLRMRTEFQQLIKIGPKFQSGPSKKLDTSR